jgi:primosomal protein N' (replication factor Y)
MQNKIYNVIVSVKINRVFSYLSDFDLNAGDIVKVPFGRQEKVGIIIEVTDKAQVELDKLKYISHVISEKIFTEKYIKFIRKFANYNILSLSQVCDIILPHLDILTHKFDTDFYSLNANLAELKFTPKQQKLANILEKKELDIAELENLEFKKPYIRDQVKKEFLLKKTKVEKKNLSQDFNYQKPDFSDEQAKVLTELKKIVGNEKYSTSIINGVTGSGKTEVYFDLIEQKLTGDNQVLFLVPEILLTKQLISKFENRFGVTPYIWHSNSGAKEKKLIWHGIENSSIKIVLGTRSALFLPFKNLELIVIDEEHDGSYKQEEKGNYNARDMAIIRANIENIPVIMGSATPAMETILNAQNQKYHGFNLHSRFGKSIQPKIKIIDLKAHILEQHRSLTLEMREQIKNRLLKKEQAMLFLNRRGYAPLKICNACGFRYKCDNCDIFLVEHKKKNKMICHHCDFSLSNTNDCSSCESKNSVSSVGVGIEKLHEEVREYFPDANIAILTSEESSNTKKIEVIFKEIEEGVIDIIIGTQVISKGHHFKNLTLVGVVNADIGDIGDIRMNEKMFQVIHQVSGRAGREEKPGEVVIQTYNPTSSFLTAIKEFKVKEFYEYELENRKKYDLPPYSKLTAIIISALNEKEAEFTAKDLKKYLDKYENIKIMGPAKAPLYFLRNHYRYRILIKSPKNQNLQKIFEPIFDKILASKVKIKIDVDPVSFL